MRLDYSQGEVLRVDESLINLIPQLNPQRQSKPFRYVIVVQDHSVARDRNWEALLVCPIHSDHNSLTSWDVELPNPPIPALPKLKSKSWVVIPSIQPVKKSDIVESLGVLPMNDMVSIYQRLVEYTGLGDFARHLSV